MPSISTSALSEVVTFTGLVRVTGKNVTASHKLTGAIKNGADVGALVAAGKHRKAVIDRLAMQGRADTAHALSVGNIRPVCALLVEVSGKAVSLMEIDGKAPYSEFLRMGASLAALPQTNKAGKPTAAAKALDLYCEYKALSDEMRAGREERRASIRAGILANSSHDENRATVAALVAAGLPATEAATEATMA
jgi:hypothetical protein